MDKIQLELENVICEHELIGVEKQALECHIVTLNFALKFGEWLDSLTEEDMSDITMEGLLKFFKDEVY